MIGYEEAIALGYEFERGARSQDHPNEPYPMTVKFQGKPIELWKPQYRGIIPAMEAIERHHAAHSSRGRQYPIEMRYE